MWFRSWIDVLGIGTQPRRSRPGQRFGDRRRQLARRLLLEGLEPRQLLAFLPAGDFSVGTNPVAVVTGDFNDDGRLDLATASAAAGTVSVLLGDGAGGFGDAMHSTLGTLDVHRVSLTVADFDNDGDDDLATVAQNYETGLYWGVRVLLSSGDGTFRSPTGVSTYSAALAVAAGDFDNDGISDLVVTGFDDYAAWDGWDVGFVQVLRGNGQGGFSQAPACWHGYSKADLTVGDLNGDGNLDVVAVDGEYYGYSGVALLGNGAGAFVSQYDFYTTDFGIGGAAVGDFTGDGIPDLVVAGSNSVDTFGGRGDGTFADPVGNSANGNGPTGVAAADFNGDGLLDAVKSDATGIVSLLLGNGNGTLAEAQAFDVGSSPSAIAVGDFNGDGRPDAAAANAESNTVSVLLNDGAGANSPWLRTDDATVTEGNAGDTSAGFVMTLSAASSETVTVHYATADGEAASGSDYQAISGTLTFAPGEISKTVTVPVHGDRLGESDETFVVNLSGAINATIADGRGVGTIVNDEPWVNITRTVYQTEGNAGQTPIAFDVMLSQAYDLPVTVNWATADSDAIGSATQGPATAGSDYQASGGTLTFAPGETSKTITVPILGDTIFERDEWFSVYLSGATTNARIGQHFGDAHILNDDVAPKLAINDVSVLEGNSGTVAAVFTVTLSIASQQSITVDFAAGDVSATVGSDYQAASGTLTFAPGETSKTITVFVNGDTLVEPDEIFRVSLSNANGAVIADGAAGGTIRNDDPSHPTLSITDVTKKEGKKGKTSFTFTVTLSAAYDQPVTMSYQTMNGTARTSDNDYVAKTGTLTFAPGETTKTITIEVKGDSEREGNETFYLDLFGLSENASFTKNRGIGTILNDD